LLPATNCCQARGVSLAVTTWQSGGNGRRARRWAFSALVINAACQNGLAAARGRRKTLQHLLPGACQRVLVLRRQKAARTTARWHALGCGALTRDATAEERRQRHAGGACGRRTGTQRHNFERTVAFWGRLGFSAGGAAAAGVNGTAAALPSGASAPLPCRRRSARGNCSALRRSSYFAWFVLSGCLAAVFSGCAGAPEPAARDTS